MSEPVAIPLQEAIDAGDQTPAAPRRGRGRPRGSKTRLHRLPGLPGRPRAERAPTRASVPRASLKTRIAGLLVTVNFALMLIPPLSNDALSPGELDALAGGIDAQCQQSARFRRYVEAALSAGSGGQLIGVVAMIGARRAARHGVLGPNGPAIDAMLGGMFNDKADDSAPSSAPPPSTTTGPVSGGDPVVVDTEPAPVDTRPVWTPPLDQDSDNGAAPFNFEETLSTTPQT